MYSPLPIALGREGGHQAGEFVNTKKQKIFAKQNILIKHKWTRMHQKLFCLILTDGLATSVIHQALVTPHE